MTVLTEKKQYQPVATSVQVRLLRATWSLPPETEQSNGAPREPGFGARLAVRKFGGTLDKLADS